MREEMREEGKDGRFQFFLFRQSKPGDQKKKKKDDTNGKIKTMLERSWCSQYNNLMRPFHFKKYTRVEKNFKQGCYIPLKYFE